MTSRSTTTHWLSVIGPLSRQPAVTVPGVLCIVRRSSSVEMVWPDAAGYITHWATVQNPQTIRDWPNEGGIGQTMSGSPSGVVREQADLTISPRTEFAHPQPASGFQVADCVCRKSSFSIHGLREISAFLGAESSARSARLPSSDRKDHSTLRADNVFAFVLTSLRTKHPDFRSKVGRFAGNCVSAFPAGGGRLRMHRGAISCGVSPQAFARAGGTLQRHCR